MQTETLTWKSKLSMYTFAHFDEVKIPETAWPKVFFIIVAEIVLDVSVSKHKLCKRFLNSNHGLELSCFFDNSTSRINASVCIRLQLF